MNKDELEKTLQMLDRIEELQRKAITKEQALLVCCALALFVTLGVYLSIIIEKLS